jgi:hypothetical protein
MAQATANGKLVDMHPSAPFGGLVGELVAKFLAETPCLTVIAGPPGSGKSWAVKLAAMRAKRALIPVDINHTGGDALFSGIKRAGDFVMGSDGSTKKAVLLVRGMDGRGVRQHQGGDDASGEPLEGGDCGQQPDRP